MYKKIFTGLDGSLWSDHAMTAAVSLAEGVDGAEIIGCHVYAAELHRERFEQMEPGLPDEYQEEEKLDYLRGTHESLITDGMVLISDSYLAPMVKLAETRNVKVLGSTPEGRHAGPPLADGGLSPAAGRDRNGPTAVLHSVSKINLEMASNGTLLNMKFLPSFFDNRRAFEKFVVLLRSFCKLKIPHVQFNVVSAEMLRQAQLRPEEYAHLVIRVAGYSAYFTELARDLQDEIIRRTEFADIE